MKLCVIGNSHAGVLQAAFRENPRADLALSFFVKSNFGPNEAKIEGSVISAGSENFKYFLQKLGMSERLDLSEFDGIILVAMSASVFTVSSLLAKHRVYGWPSTQQLLAGEAETTRPLRRSLLSEAAVLATLVHATRRLAAYEILKAVRETSSIPVCIVPQPFPSERILAPAGNRRALKRIHRGGDGPALVRQLEHSYREAFSPFDQVTHLRQPDQTIAAGWLTSDAYSRDGVRVNGIASQPRTDILHANASFGHLVLDAAVEAIHNGQFDELDQNPV